MSKLTPTTLRRIWNRTEDYDLKEKLIKNYGHTFNKDHVADIISFDHIDLAHNLLKKHPHVFHNFHLNYIVKHAAPENPEANGFMKTAKRVLNKRAQTPNV